jgi:hypothetical protein
MPANGVAYRSGGIGDVAAFILLVGHGVTLKHLVEPSIELLKACDRLLFALSHDFASLIASA